MKCFTNESNKNVVYITKKFPKYNKKEMKKLWPHKTFSSFYLLRALCTDLCDRRFSSDYP